MNGRNGALFTVRSEKTPSQDTQQETALYRPLLLNAHGLRKRFGAVVALDGIDFSIPRHSVVSLIGPNGSGKTVLFNIFIGLVRPDEGTIYYNGGSIRGLPPDRITVLGIAQTFQNIRLFGNMTTLENVLVGQHCRLRYSVWNSVLRASATTEEERRAAERAMQLLEQLGMKA